jgi:hypothetical protein
LGASRDRQTGNDIQRRGTRHRQRDTLFSPKAVKVPGPHRVGPHIELQSQTEALPEHSAARLNTHHQSRARTYLGRPEHVRARWNAWRQLPHSKLWQASDWDFAFDTAELLAKAADADGDGPVALWSEIRLRERTLGTTWDARQSMRLRCVASLPDEDGQGGPVSQLDDYRNL